MKRFCGESRIRTCEVFTADLQSALVGRLSISPEPLSTTAIVVVSGANIGTLFISAN